MAKAAKQNAKTGPVPGEFDTDYERIMKLARLVNPAVPIYHEHTEESQPLETITTYGVQITTP